MHLAPRKISHRRLLWQAESRLELKSAHTAVAVQEGQARALRQRLEAIEGRFVQQEERWKRLAADRACATPAATVVAHLVCPCLVHLEA